MIPHRFYIQQLSFDGSEYTTGPVFDSYEEWGIACKDFPFLLFPEPKAPVTKDWPGEDGVEVYSPSVQPLNSYDIDVEFIVRSVDCEEFASDDDDATILIASTVRDFIQYLYGRKNGSIGSLLAIYDEYTMIGRKDVRVKKVSTEAYYRKDGGNDGIIAFRVTFTVYDPVTDVVLQTSNGVKTFSFQ